MHLSHKLALVLMLFSGANLFGTTQENNEPQSPANTIFTLRTLVDASYRDQVAMVTALLENRELSDEKIAAMLEVEVSAVTRARTYLGPRELELLINTAVHGYNARCYKHVLLKKIILPGVLICAAYGLTVGWGLWYLEYQHNVRLREYIDRSSSFSNELIQELERREKWFWWLRR